MQIYLYGPSGSGKSTIGKQLAQALNLPFLDLDAEIEKKLGESITEFMTAQGKEAFRDAESEALKNTSAGDEKVIALGGGALLREENHLLAEKSGKIVFLDAALSALMKRLSVDSNQRPLLTENLEEKLVSLLKARESHYASFSLRVDANQEAEKIVWDIHRLLGRYHLCAMPPNYDVLVEEGGLDRLGEMLQSRGLKSPVMVVSDTNIAPLYMQRALDSLKSAGYAASEIVIPTGEENKTLETISSLWRAFLEAGLDRKSTIVALGGGVVGDLTGFAASTFMRGCNWVALPTTLLAMVDASMGGKTGFDLPEGKNLVGAFHPPRMVLADPELLATLPERELRSGMAEVVKHGVVEDTALFEICSQGWDAVVTKLPEIVRRGMAVKVKIIEEDPFEQGIRAALNFGHTIGHAVELVSKFGFLHGEAVSIGMVAETKLAENLGLAQKGLSELLAASLLALGLPVEIPNNLPRPDLVRAMTMDKKKAAGIVRFALPVEIGKMEIGVEIKDLEKAL